MVLNPRTPQDFLNDLAARTQKYPTMLDLSDQVNLLSTVIREFNQEVFTTRFMLIKNPGLSIDMTKYSIDEIIDVVAPKQVDVFIREFGLLPFFAVNNVLDLESLEEYLIFKGNWSNIRRQYGNAFTWDFSVPPTLNVNGNYATLLIEFLPYITGDIDQSNLNGNLLNWQFYDIEFLYICDLLFYSFNIRNMEIFLASTPLGIGKEAAASLQYWQQQIADKRKAYLSQQTITYSTNEGNW